MPDFDFGSSGKFGHLISAAHGGFESIEHSYVTLGKFTQVSSEPELSGETGQPVNIRVEPTQTENNYTGLLTSEVDISARLISVLPAEVDISARLISNLPAEVDISARLISTLPAEVDISARLIWSLPAAMPAATVDVTATTCKRMLTNHTMHGVYGSY